MTYDIVRKALDGRNVWLLILESYGINVWCAAGKGSFGTGEIVRRVASSGLSSVVRHRWLILPILGASGVAAHQVAKRSGFSVRYAAIRAADLPEYLDNGMATTPEMRQMKFTFYDRLVLVPVEVVLKLKHMAAVSAAVMILAALGGNFTGGAFLSSAYAGAVFAGTAIAPLLLPWLPGRSFAVKGAIVGLFWVFICCLIAGKSWNFLQISGALLILPSVSAFCALNFTGCTPFTSRSGVKKELRVGLPAMAASVVAGCFFFISGALS